MACLAVVFATWGAAINPQSAQASTYVSPQFFGQHLMYFWGLKPLIPVHAMRLWDSNTRWCEMDSGTASGKYNFGQLDALLGQASRLGADVQFTFGGTPTWVTTGSYPQPSVVNQCDWSAPSGITPGAEPANAEPPAGESHWKNFVTALVTNAKGKIHAYEIWNEADYSVFWSGSVAQMVQMTIDAAGIIHSIDPSALVLSPSISASQNGYNWLHQYLSSLPTGTINAVAVHPYTEGAWPEFRIPEIISSVRAALPSAYANIPIWATEGGWGENSQFSMTDSDQRAFVARYDLQLLTQHVVRSYWYAYPNGAWGTLGSPDGTTLKPAGVASGTIYSWLAGATFQGCSSTDQWSNLWTCNITSSKVSTLDGGSSPAPDSGSIQVLTEPLLLS